MRTISGIIFLICCLFCCHAQTNVYHPFPDSGMVWNMAIGGSECSTCYKRSYYISGDTVLNATACRKIEYKEITGISLPPWYHCSYPFTTGTTVYAGALHEDTASRKVFLFLPGSATDSLLYDFSLGIGDTLDSGMNNSISPNIYIDQIDSVLIGGNYRKRFLLGNTVSSGLIEGIGSTTGLLDDIFVFECGGYLGCVSLNGQTIYPDTISLCDLMDGVNEFTDLTSELHRVIYPNPASSQLILDCSQNSINSIEVINLTGEIIYSSVINQASCILNCESFSPGIYFLKATSGENIFFEKFIKN
jgi:hypothetical protein